MKHEASSLPKLLIAVTDWIALLALGGRFARRRVVGFATRSQTVGSWRRWCLMPAQFMDSRFPDCHLLAVDLRCAGRHPQLPW